MSELSCQCVIYTSGNPFVVKCTYRMFITIHSLQKKNNGNLLKIYATVIAVLDESLIYIWHKILNNIRAHILRTMTNLDLRF